LCDRRRDLPRDTLKANGLEAPARSIDEGAERRWINRLAGKPRRTQVLKHRRGKRGVPNKLLLGGRKLPHAAEILFNAVDKLGAFPICNGSAIDILKR